MKIIVTKSQYKKLIIESTEKNLETKLDGLKNFFDRTNKEIKEQVKSDISFLTTWGVTIAGFVQPIEEFLKGEFPSLSTTNLALLSTGIILTYYTSNKEMLSKVLKKIEEDGLIFEFESMLKIARKLKSVFLNFIDSLAIPISKIGNMMAYTFLIPIIPELFEIAQGIGDYDYNDIINRVLMFVSINGLSILTKKLIKEIVKRFKS